MSRIVGERREKKEFTERRASLKEPVVTSLHTCMEPVAPDPKDDVSSWCYDVFNAARVHDGLPLHAVFISLLNKMNLFKMMNLDEFRCRNYMKKIEANYMNNPYHNVVHATDVLQSVGVILLTDKYYKQFTNLELLAMILSAAVHDVGHPGLNNDFHKRARSKLAQKYKDSFNERMHIDRAYEILHEDDSCNMLMSLSNEDYARLERYVEAIIIATDMAYHYELVAEFEKRFPIRNGRTMDGMVEEDKTLLLKMIVHCADISNPTRPWKICRNWSSRINQELLEQGDKEISCGLEVSRPCDRRTANLAASQRHFLEKFVIPCFKVFGSVVPSFAKMTLEIAEVNKKHWDDAVAESTSQ